VRFVFKINSAFDGFRPAVIEQRLEADGRLSLGWQKYVEAVELGSEVWVYFRGPHRFEDGVYLKGTVDEIDVGGRRVLLRVRESSTEEPLTDPATAQRIADLVSQRFQQVFLVPEEAAPLAACTFATTAQSCRARNCGYCPVWAQLPRVDRDTLGCPERLSQDFEDFVPAYWVLPPRTFLYYTGRVVRAPIRLTSETFKRFKTGEEDLAYPLALGIRESLIERDLANFDCVIPIPLSPDKEAAGEIHRTRLLAQELAQLLGIDVLEVLTLNRPISKRVLRVQNGYTAQEFENAYEDALDIHADAESLGRVLLIDDVCTEGSTLSVAYGRLMQLNPDCTVVGATAGQMAVRAAVSDEEQLLE
jgi:predicted amidophosphoribosyltransferase